MNHQIPPGVHVCPECGRVASVPEWCARPICVHAWDGSAPEVWDGDDVDGDGRSIEQSPSQDYRLPGPTTWAEMNRMNRWAAFTDDEISLLLITIDYYALARFEDDDERKQLAAELAAEHLRRGLDPAP